MSRTLRSALLVAGVLAGLLAAHVQLNLGGWSRFLRRAASGGTERGQLVVGFLPVT